MPINPSINPNPSITPSAYDIDALRQLQVNQAQEASLRWTASATSNLSTYAAYRTRIGGRDEPRSELQQNRQWEKRQLERFIKTGSCDFNMYIANGKLVVFGAMISNSRFLVQIDDKTIVGVEKRVKHLKPLLAKLAKREGFELELGEAVPETGPRTKQVAYYAFKNLEPVDDSELVGKTKLRTGQNNGIDLTEDGETYCECDDYCTTCRRHDCICDDEGWD